MYPRDPICTTRDGFERNLLPLPPLSLPAHSSVTSNFFLSKISNFTKKSFYAFLTSLIGLISTVIKIKRYVEGSHDDFTVFSNGYTAHWADLGGHVAKIQIIFTNYIEQTWLLSWYYYCALGQPYICS